MYQPGTEVSTHQDEGKATVSPGPPPDGISNYVVILGKDGQVYFSDTVEVGKDYTATVPAGYSKFDSTTTLLVYDIKDGPLVQEVTYHTSCSQPINFGDVIGSFIVTDPYLGQICAVGAGLPPPPAVTDVCEICGKPLELVFQYMPGTEVNTKQDDGKATVSGEKPDGINNYVVIKGKDGQVYFKDTVEVGKDYTATIPAGYSKFDSTTTLLVYDNRDGPLVQIAEYHTSCSQPINIGDVIGSFIVTVPYVGQSCTLLTPPAASQHEITIDFGDVAGDESLFTAPANRYSRVSKYNKEENQHRTRSTKPAHFLLFHH
jgi:hypothetical protein